ncbi:MAG TPA: ABC transporter ATP-binding protein [Bryobacteraceae bacterium]|nr:ABC transporter ATP-binding protein [Bryobacteraceae bacterium]
MEEEILGKAYDARLMRRLVRYLRPYRATVIVSLGFLVVQSLAQVCGPILTQLAIDKYLARPDHPVESVLNRWLSSNTWTGLAQISGLYLAAVLIAFAAEFTQTYLMQRTGQYAMFDLRRELMAHLQRLDMSYYDRNPVGRLLTRVTTDVDALNELWSSGLVEISADLLGLALAIMVMVRMSPGLTLLLVLVMPVVILVTARFRKAVQQSYRRIRVAIARINAYLQEHVNGMAVLQLFNREGRSRQEFTRINRDHMEAYKDAIQAYGWFYPVIEFLSMLALAALLAYGGFRIRSGFLSLGVMVAFFQYGQRFFRPIQDLSEKYNILQAAMAASERVFKLLDTPAAITSPRVPKPFPQEAASVEFDHVWFAYKDEDWVLRDVSFRIEPGETIAVVGHTGAGKTTLASLLLRFYDIQRGSIKIGGVDIREFALDDLRRHFGVVLQDPHLFTGTLDSNIRLGSEQVSDEAIASAAAQVNLLDFVRALPEEFAHPVRERGNGFSTGQKQLISFARALAHNPRFLILDEATSSVDTETEFRVCEALANMVEGRTSLIIAHRLSTIQRADRILVMHKSQLRESGTHQQLLAARGIYWTLYQLQYKDQENHGNRSQVSDREIFVPAGSNGQPAAAMDR